MIVNNSRLHWLLVAGFLVTPLQAAEESLYADPKAVLDRLHSMIEAVKTTEYAGRFVYQQGQQLELLEISHSTRQDGAEQVRLKALTGDATEIIHDGDAVVCVYPDAHSSSVALNAIPQGISPLLPDTLNSLTALYQLKYSGTDRLVGRPVDVFSIVPRDQYRYGMRFYIDQASALPLKIDKFDEYGKSITQIMFTDISFKVSPAFGPVINKRGGDRFVVMERNSSQVPKNTEESSWQLPSLAGYQEVNRRVIEGKKHHTEHVILGDGLSSMSVYIEFSDKSNRLDGFASIGAVHAYGKRFGDIQVTAIGEVPLQAIAFVVNGFEQKSSDD